MSFAGGCLLVAAAFAVMAGCNQPDFPKYNELGNLRILTVLADTPEANPGDTVTFTPVLSDINGEGRTIAYSVHACIDPGLGIGVAPACPSPDPGSIQSGSVTIPASASQTYTGPVASFSLTVPDAAVVFANRSPVDLYNGVAYLVFYSISVPGGPSIDSFLRVFITPVDKSPKNRNPEITSIDLEDVPLTGTAPMPTSSANFRATSPAASSETYRVMQRDGSFTTRTEELVNTWFVSDGTFDFIRTIGNSENSWTPPEAKPAGRGMVILVVTRDGRGGAAVQKIEMN
jgi:hypothetical protein